MKLKQSSFSQRLFLGVIFVLIFSYTLYHMVSLFSEEIATFAAGVTTERTVLSENGYIFRDETLLTSPYGGSVDYHAAAGVKVSKGQALATVYEEGEADTRERIARLDRQIALLESSFGDSLKTAEMGALKESVSTSYDALIKQLATGDAVGLSARADAFLMGLNQMNGLAKGEEAEGYATLEALKAERQSLLNSNGASKTYHASTSGYFYTQVDGYEDEFTMAAAESLTASSFYELLEQMSRTSPVEEPAYGKMCYSPEWILVLPIAPSDQKYFEVGGTYFAEFYQNNRTLIPLTLERAVEAPEQDAVLLVLRADRLPQNFSFDRCQSVRLEVASRSGIYVPKNVVERVDGLRGVYVLRGSVVYFRRIEIVYDGDDYYLVKEGVEDQDTPYLQVNDLIILNGKNMFDGRVLD